MKLIQINPKIKNKQSILSALNKIELSLREKNTSFQKYKKNKWKHIKFNGWINFREAIQKILFVKVQSKVEADEKRLLESFIGYITRHCEDLIDSITIYYR